LLRYHLQVGHDHHGSYLEKNGYAQEEHDYKIAVHHLLSGFQISKPHNSLPFAAFQ